MIFEVVDKRTISSSVDEAKLKRLLDKLEGSFKLKKNDKVLVCVKPYGNSLKVEVTISTETEKMRAETVHDDIYSGVEISVLKIKDAVRKIKKSHMSPEGNCTIDGNIELKPVRTKAVSIEKMDVSKAIETMELIGHDFYVYRDSDKGCVSIVYKRNDGRYGYIETE